MDPVEKFKKILYSCKTQDHLDIAKNMINVCPELFNDCYDYLDEFRLRNDLFLYIKEMKDYLEKKCLKN